MVYNVNETKSVGEPISGELTLPLKSWNKIEIAQQVDAWLEDVTMEHDAGDVYVYLKQMELAVERAIETIKDPAFNSVSTGFGSEKTGTVLGHEVKLTYPQKWEYSEAVAVLKAKQELELEALQAKEKSEGKAKQVPGTGVITVTLRKGIAP